MTSSPLITMTYIILLAEIISNTNTPEDTIVLTNWYTQYTFTSYGGGLRDVDLIKYPETVFARRQRRGETNDFATLNERPEFTTLALIGSEAVQGDGIFNLTKIPNGVRAEKTLSNGLSIVKEFSR